MRSATRLACSAGLSTIVQPDASTGASFQSTLLIGLFQGMIDGDDADRLLAACR